jgi:hypothetical protein
MKSFDRAEILGTVRDRADSDPAFRSQLLSNPVAVMSDLLGMPLPTGVRISVHEESPTDIHLVIPAVSNLDDVDLELVAGGTDWNVNGFCGCCAI